MTSLWKIFLVFAKIGAFTIGGGYAMIPLIRDEMVKRGWMTDEELPDIIALAQSAPGVLAVNMSVFAGYRLRGVKGSIAATLGATLPSFLIILAIVRFYTRFKDNRIFEGVMSWIRPAVAGLIGAAALILMFNVGWSGTPLFSEMTAEVVKDNFPDLASWILFAAAVVASLGFKIGPIPIIIAGGILGLILY